MCTDLAFDLRKVMMGAVVMDGHQHELPMISQFRFRDAVSSKTTLSP